MEPRRILVVDDDPDTRALVRRALAQEFASAEIREATDEAGLAGQLQDWPPDILVTDLDLRWSNGFDVFDRARAAAPDCATVMFTGTGDEELAVRAMKHGFDDYLVKRANQLRRLSASARLAFVRRRERRGLTESRDLVLKELYHRLHNNLQIVVSLLRMTEKAVTDEAARRQLADLGRRIQALTALQERFYRSDDLSRVDFGAYLEALARGLVGGRPDRARLEAAVEPTTLTVDVAVPLGLIANEMITNAIKHAFPEGGGTLRVALARDARGLVMTIADDGVGSGPNELGLGTRLVERLAAQIGAEVAIDRAGRGTVCTVTLAA